MAILGVINKQPREILDFDIDYSLMMEDRPGEVLSSVTTEVTPSGVTVSNATINATTNRSKIIIANGADGITYKVTVMTGTSLGLLYEDEVTVVVSEA